MFFIIFFFFSSRRRHTRWPRDWSSDVCSSDLQSHSIEVRCLPRHLPSVVEVDVTPLSIVDNFRVGDLKLDGDIEILDDPETVIVTVVPPRIEEPEPDAAAEAAAEPEVIKKGKAEE